MSRSIVDKPNRVSMPMSNRDWIDLELIRNSPSSLDLDSAGRSITSDAQLTKHVYMEGLRVVRERIEEEIYAQMARDQELIREQDAQRRRLVRRGRELTKD